jgi:hypothetical protein
MSVSSPRLLPALPSTITANAAPKTNPPSQHEATLPDFPLIPKITPTPATVHPTPTLKHAMKLHSPAPQSHTKISPSSLPIVSSDGPAPLSSAEVMVLETRQSHASPSIGLNLYPSAGTSPQTSAIKSVAVAVQEKDAVDSFWDSLFEWEKDDVDSFWDSLKTEVVATLKVSACDGKLSEISEVKSCYSGDEFAEVVGTSERGTKRNLADSRCQSPQMQKSMSRTLCSLTRVDLRPDEPSSSRISRKNTMKVQGFKV